MNKLTNALAALALSLPLSLTAQTIIDYGYDQWPDDRYKVHGDGTVTDKQTGLMWALCAVGQTYSADTCSDVNDAAEMEWPDALEAAADSTFAGYSDWRLPNIKEFVSLNAFDRDDPSVNISIFPNFAYGDNYWTSTPHPEDGDDSWNFGFKYGGYWGDRSRTNTNSTSQLYARLVRAGDE